MVKKQNMPDHDNNHTPKETNKMSGDASTDESKLTSSSGLSLVKNPPADADTVTPEVSVPSPFLNENPQIAQEQAAVLDQAGLKPGDYSLAAQGGIVKRDKTQSIGPNHVLLCYFVVYHGYGTILKYFGQIGFRLYDESLGVWQKQDPESLLGFFVNRASKLSRGPYARNFTQKTFIKAFVDWLRDVSNQQLPDSSWSHIAFLNGTLDLRSMRLVDHHRNNYTMKALNTVFRHGPPCQEVLDFFFDFCSFDAVKINILRELLKIVLTNRQSFNKDEVNGNLDLIFYFWGGSTVMRGILLKVIEELADGDYVSQLYNTSGTGNCAYVQPKDFTTQSRRVNLIGASVVFLREIFSKHLTEDLMLEVIRFTSGQSQPVKIQKGRSVSVRGLVVITTQNAVSNIETLFRNEEISQRVVCFPLKEHDELQLERQPQLGRAGQQLLEQKLRQGLAGIICWVMAMPSESILMLSNNVPYLSQDMRTPSEKKAQPTLLDHLKLWMSLDLRLLANNTLDGSFEAPSKSKPGSLYYGFFLWAQKNNVIFKHKRGEASKLMVRAIIELGVQDKVQWKKNTATGWRFTGLTFDTTLGEKIVYKPSPVNKAIKYYKNLNRNKFLTENLVMDEFSEPDFTEF